MPGLAKQSRVGSTGKRVLKVLPMKNNKLEEWVWNSSQILLKLQTKGRGDGAEDVTNEVLLYWKCSQFLFISHEDSILKFGLNTVQLFQAFT